MQALAVDQHGMGSPFQDSGSDLQIEGLPTVDMFTTVHYAPLPQFMSPVPEPRGLEVNALSQPC